MSFNCYDELYYNEPRGLIRGLISIKGLFFDE
jgi:hypothetical protein